MNYIIGKKSYLANHLYRYFKKNGINVKLVNDKQIELLHKDKNFKNIFLFTFYFDKKKKSKNIDLLKKISLLSKFKLFYPSTIGVIKYQKYKYFKNFRYWAQKNEIENFIKKNMNKYLILRIPNVYGPNMRQIYKIQKIILNIKSNKILNFSRPSHLRDYIHITDLLKIFYTSIYKKKNKVIINIGTNNIYDDMGILKILKDKINLKFKYKILKNKNKITEFYYEKKTKNINFIKLKDGLEMLFK